MTGRPRPAGSTGIRLTLDDWEAKTQLGEVDRRSIAEIQETCVELPIPAKVCQYDN